MSSSGQAASKGAPTPSQGFNDSRLHLTQITFLISFRRQAMQHFIAGQRCNVQLKMRSLNGSSHHLNFIEFLLKVDIFYIYRSSLGYMISQGYSVDI